MLLSKISLLSGFFGLIPLFVLFVGLLATPMTEMRAQETYQAPLSLSTAARGAGKYACHATSGWLRRAGFPLAAHVVNRVGTII